jgi:hypothetical protein
MGGACFEKQMINSLNYGMVFTSPKAVFLSEWDLRTGWVGCEVLMIRTSNDIKLKCIEL